MDAAIKQHYGQCSCQHLTNPDFLEKYLEGGYDLCISEFPYLYLNYPQLVSDNTAFYYGLASVMSDKCQATVDEYADVRDGMLLYLSFQQQFGLDGTLSDSHALEYESILERRYEKNYPGGLLTFVNEKMTAYAQLEQMGQVYSDATKQRALMMKIYIPGHNLEVYNHLQTLPSFRSCCEYLLKSLTLDNVIHQGEARRRATLATVDEPDHSRLDDEREIQALLARKDLPPNLQIPDELFRCIPRDALKEFLLNRKRLVEGESGRRGGDGDIPSQYGATGSEKNDATIRANKATADEDATGDDPLSEQLELMLKALTAQANLNRSAMMFRVTETTSSSRVVHVDLSADKRQKIRALLAHSKPGHTFTISDVGADTTICGKNWKRVADTGRFASVQGFDEVMLTKRNLPIGTHITKAHPTGGPPFLLRAHESVTNEGSQITLYSTFQGRQAGVLIDDVWHGHRRIDGKKGTQRIVFPNQDGTHGHELPLQLRSALLMFRHSLPTPEEYNVETGESTLPIYDLTGEGTWNPESFFDDTAALDYDNDIYVDNPLIVANTASTAPEVSTTETDSTEKDLAETDSEISKFYDARGDSGELSIDDDGNVVDEQGLVFSRCH